MTSFSAEKETRLLLARDEFRTAMFEDDFFAELVAKSVEAWNVSPDPKLALLMQPSLMPGIRGEDVMVTGGVQLAFVDKTAKYSSQMWQYIDLFTYRPEMAVCEYNPSVAESPGYSDLRAEQLFAHWTRAVRTITAQFDPQELRINKHTGEIDLRENIPEGKTPLLLPLNES
jgi:hypothetical protein